MGTEQIQRKQASVLNLIIISSLLSVGNSEVETSLCSNYCTLSYQRCKCDPNCSIFGDCCVDSEHLANKNRRTRVHCSAVEGTSHLVYQTDTCPPDYNVTDIKEKCYKSIPLDQDPFLNLPVTSSKTQITYKNRYCSLCNDDNATVPWNVEINLNIPVPQASSYVNESGDFIRDNLVYYDNKWGVWLRNGDKHTFQSVTFDIRRPDDDLPRWCSQYISVCPPEWKNATIQELCNLYEDFIIYNGRKFKNKYCAQCFGISEEYLSCSNSKYIVKIVGGRASFTTVLTYLSSSSLREVPQCPEDQVYDHIFKKCREVLTSF